MMTRAARLFLAMSLAASLLPTTAPGTAPVQGGTEAIPDLAVAPLSDFQIQNVGGQRLLRFTSSMVNVGPGQFEVRGHRLNASQPMEIEQWIYTDPSRSTVSSILATPAGAHFAGDGHSHWHVQEMMRYDLWNGTVTAPGAKVGFCFLDLEPYNTSLPGASGSPFYLGCGSSPNATGFIMGISIGWADTYHAGLPFQWVDITGLPSGTYTLRVRVDPNGYFVETNESNQCAYTTVFISGSSVQVLGSGSECVNDWSGSSFAGDIAWAFDAGITTGCAPELFCPARTVSREEMASFIARARGLTPQGTDWFTDDETSIHEPAINAIRDEGITLGCGPNLFCPKSLVTREQMASFLIRALGLTTVGTDYFTDDNGSIHEGDINTLRAEEITTGCGPMLFCPTGLVTREQMAAFLHRALD
jgi:Lysyl oxidase/S-layer homology domain